MYETRTYEDTKRKEMEDDSCRADLCLFKHQDKNRIIFCLNIA